MRIIFLCKPILHNGLITIGKASPLKYFPQGHIKKGYALFESPNLKDKKKLKSYFQKAIKDALEKG